MCLGGKIKNRSCPGCCGKTKFNSTTQVCCESKAYARFKLGSEQACCGSKAYMTCTEICCSGNIFDKQKMFMRCCGSQGYNPANEICCGGQVQKKYVYNGCCDGKGYNTDTQMCCKGQIFSNDFTSCCYVSGRVLFGLYFWLEGGGSHKFYRSILLFTFKK